jgi:hypothetical protein
LLLEQKEKDHEYLRTVFRNQLIPLIPQYKVLYKEDKRLNAKWQNKIQTK